MARYIDADKFYNKLDSMQTKRKECTIDYLEVFEMLDKIPTADVEEVKHGEWQLKSETHRFLEEIDEEFYVECPFCHRVYYVPFEFEDEKMLEYARKNYPYCNCGAKMDGGKAE